MNSKVSNLNKTRCSKCLALIGLTSPIPHAEGCKAALCAVCARKQKSLKANQIGNKKQCVRCLAKPIIYHCQNCKNGYYCEECFHKTHRMGKFETHKYKLFGNDFKKDEDAYKEKISEIKEELQIHMLEYGIMEKHILQKWDQLIQGMEHNFNGLIDEMVQKKNELKQKLLVKKNKEVLKFHQILKNKVEITTERKFSKDSMINLEHQVRELRTAIQGTSADKFFSKYQLLKKPFEEVKKLISKLGTKNIFQKEQKPTNISHNRMRSSIGSNGSSIFTNSLLKTHKSNKCQLSRSTLECQLYSGEIPEKPDFEKEKGDKKSNTKEVSKVKSEKWLSSKVSKNPEWSKNYYLSKKNTKTKK